MDELLVYTRGAKASDLHLAPGRPIMLRRHGKLEPVSDETLSARAIEHIIENGINAEDMNELRVSGDLEIAHSIPGHGRYRMTFCEQRYGYALTARVIDEKVRPFEECGLPESCRVLTQWAQGMVLITGPLGCGKSSTLASLVELVNQDRPEHIISIENPIEVIYEPKKCQISQREVGRHTLSPGNALRGALRQDPDILVVSELRDLETIRLAISAAETGHLVFGTMNTNNATRTINRLIDAFPPDEQGIMRIMISESMRGIISQQLIPRKDGRGVVPAYEVLVVNRAVANMIRKDSTHQIESAMVSGRAFGMVLLDESLERLVKDDVIEGAEAFYRASNPKKFKQYAPPEMQAMFAGDSV
jgi:twitching motility protein PilT